MTASTALAHEHIGTRSAANLRTNGHPSPSKTPPSPSLSMDRPLTNSSERKSLGHSPASQLNGHSDGDLSSYTFPDSRLRQQLRDSSKTPLVLVACGSFSPITNLHLRMFEMVADHVRFNTDYEIVGGYFSPVSDAYKKSGLASAHHR